MDLGRAFNAADSDWYDITLPDGAPAQYPAWFHPRREQDGSWTALAADGTPIAMMPAGGAFYDQICFPWLDEYPAPAEMQKQLPGAMGKVLWSALVHSPWDHWNDADFWRTLRERTLALCAAR